MIKAQYTTVLKTLLDDETCKNEILTRGLGSYPLYSVDTEDETLKALFPTREQLNKKLLDYYKYREIGFETVARFIDELSITMNEIMPYYNQLFRSVHIMNDVDDIFGNVNVTESTMEITKGKASGSGKTTSKAESETINNNDMHDNAKQVHSDTPQNSLNIPAKDIDTVNYANDVQWNENNSNSKQTSKGSSDSNSKTENKSDSETERTLIYSKKGNQGVNTYAHDIIEFRQTILNVEQQIINDDRVKELFLLVY